jgi:hypothetical protein
MPPPPATFWTEQVRATLARYDEALLRQVAARLVRPRNHWPAEDLLERCVEALDNPAVVDRRLRDLEPASRRALALIGHSRQPAWALGSVVELLMALGHGDGLAPVFALLGAGLLFPAGGGEGRAPRIKGFEQWLANPGPGGLIVFAPPQVAARAVGLREDFGLPDLSSNLVEDRGPRIEDREAPVDPPSSILDPLSSVRGQEADGLEWLLRLGVLWQRVWGAPLRRTQQGGLFKRDVERLEQDPLLNGPPAEHLAGVRDPGFLVASLAEVEGVVREADGEVRAGELPGAWEGGLPAALESLWAGLFRLSGWDPQGGWRGGDEPAGNPFPSAYLLTFLLLARLPEGAWARPADLEAWLAERHPYWAGEDVRPSRRQPWVESFLLGVAYHLKLVQATRPGGEALVRLSPTGRWLLGLGECPPAPGAYPQTLLVQPNLEVVAYRQGLTPGLVGALTRFASWKTLGAACTLQLEPATVYRALESGETFESIRRSLERHGTRALPPAVLDSLRTWSDKRDRITVYPSATLLEFGSAGDLDEALARGLPGVRIADTLAVVASEDAVDFRQFRLTGTRDYGLPPERCVTVEPDGVTLTVDLARSDLLLETELGRFAERVEGPAVNGRRRYRLTPGSLGAARAAGLGPSALDVWFVQRAGQPLSPAGRLLLGGAHLGAPRLRRRLVLHVATAELADGLLQWPPTRALVEERLGPTSLAVAEENVGELRRRLREAGIDCAEEV